MKTLFTTLALIAIVLQSILLVGGAGFHYQFMAACLAISAAIQATEFD